MIGVTHNLVSAGSPEGDSAPKKINRIESKPTNSSLFVAITTIMVASALH